MEFMIYNCSKIILSFFIEVRTMSDVDKIKQIDYIK